MEPVTESYEIKTEDKECHAINTIMEVLKRHIDRSKDNPNCEENIINGHKAAIRIVDYVAARIKNT
jgi:hypothetical protein